MSTYFRLSAVTESSVPLPPAGKSSIFLDSADSTWKAKLPNGDILILSTTEEYIRDVIGNMVQSSSTINFVYDDLNDLAYFEVIQTALDIFQIPVTPTGNLASDNLGDAINELQGDIDSINTTLSTATSDISDLQNDKLNRDGSQAMTGDLDLGTNDIINVNLVDGRDVSVDGSKLDGVEVGATANSTDAQLRDRTTHTGTQLAATISDFAATVRSTVLTGISFATSTAVTAADSILIAIGKLQAQITGHFGVGGPTHPNSTTSVAGFMSGADKTKLDAISGTRIMKSGSVAGGAFAGNPKKTTITFSTPFPNTNYSINITGEDSRVWSFETKTVNGFVINANANQVFAGEVTWNCVSYGETVE